MPFICRFKNGSEQTLQVLDLDDEENIIYCVSSSQENLEHLASYINNNAVEESVSKEVLDFITENRIHLQTSVTPINLGQFTVEAISMNDVSQVHASEASWVSYKDIFLT